MHEQAANGASGGDAEEDGGFWLHEKGDWRTCFNDRGEQIYNQSQAKQPRNVHL